MKAASLASCSSSFCFASSELSGQKLCSLISLALPLLKVFLQEHGRNLRAYRLRQMRVAINNRDRKSRKILRPGLRHRLNRRNGNRGTQSALDQHVNRNTIDIFVIETKFMNQWLKAGAAQNLLLHGRQVLVAVV